MYLSSFQDRAIQNTTAGVLQCAAVCCSVLRCVAICCSALQCVAVCCSVCCCVLQCIACCSVLQCVAVCCSVLQCVAVCCSVLQFVAVCRSVSQCVAVCCSVLQRVAACCSALDVHSVMCVFLFINNLTFEKFINQMTFEKLLQRVAVCRSVLQRVAVCRSVLQCVARSPTLSALWSCFCQMHWHAHFRKIHEQADFWEIVAACCSVLQRVAVCCTSTDSVISVIIFCTKFIDTLTFEKLINNWLLRNCTWWHQRHSRQNRCSLHKFSQVRFTLNLLYRLSVDLSFGKNSKSRSCLNRCSLT